MTSSRSTNRSILAGICLAALVFSAGASGSALDRQLHALIDAQGLDGVPEGVSQIDPAAPLPGLGRALFFSKQLSGDRDVACASCHHPLLGGGDALSLPVGIGAHRPEIVGPGRLSDISVEVDPKAVTVGGPNVRRNSISTFNVGLFRKALLWDGRVSLLDATGDDGEPLYRTPESTLRSSPDGKAHGDLVAVQARFPMVSFQEMRGFGEFYSLTAAEVRNRIAARLREHESWLEAFRIAFRAPQGSAEDLITFDNITLALSEYQRSQTFIETPWRDFVRGYDSLTEDEKAGAKLFYSSADAGGFNCAACHSGDFFTDESFHAAAFPQLGRGKRADGDDPGAFLVSQEKADLYKFRTPSLLNVAVTGPWGHAGSFDSLASLIRYHANPAAGIETFDFDLEHLPQISQHGDAYANAKALTETALEHASELLPHRSPTDEEVDQLVAFLGALTDPCVQSRECLQPWIANYLDDYDGQLLQPLFETAAGPFPFDVNAPVAEAGVQAAVGDATPVARPVDYAEIRRRAACEFHEPRRPASGATGFTERTSELGIDHEHFIPGEMWYGSRYSFTVEFAMHSGPMSSGDLNGDCLPDLIFGTHSGDAPRAIAYLNTGNGFEARDLELPGMPDAIGAFGLADLDGDYQLDLAVGNLFGARETALYRASGDAEFELAQKISMSKVVFGFAFADYSGDGWLDMFATHWDIEARPAQAPALMKNIGGVMKPADSEAGTTGADLEQNFHFSPAFADFDHDGDQDLVIASDFDTSEALENTGQGTFDVVTDREVISDENGMGLAIADFNNDGNLDWFLTAIYKEDTDEYFEWGETGNRIYFGTGEGVTFVDRTTGSGIREGDWAWGACAADFNNDGWVDIFHENGFGSVPEYAEEHIPGYLYQLMPASLAPFHQTRPRLFINRGDGTFVESGREWGFTEETNGRGVVCLDYDRDGDIDIATTQNAAKPKIYENNFRGSKADGFVGFHLIGTQPNTFAIGATVTIESAGHRQMRAVQANSNFQGQNPSTLHFGLGDARSVDRVTIRWPDGQTESIVDVEPGKYYPLLHPSLREPELVAGTSHAR